MIFLFLPAKGYERLADGAYYSEPEGLLVFDVLPRNAILAADGRIYPIDPPRVARPRNLGLMAVAPVGVSASPSSNAPSPANWLDRIRRKT